MKQQFVIMRNLTKLSIWMVAFSLMALSACKDESADPAPGDGGGKNQTVEGDYVGTWISPNEQLPTQYLRDKYDHFELILEQDDRYKFTWFSKVGTDVVYEGAITHQKTEYKHSSNSAIWLLSIWVETINGQNAPGGWDGIYTYENPTTLKMNFEPRVTNWSKWPTAEEGLGSGQDGEGSIYTFTKQ